MSRATGGDTARQRTDALRPYPPSARRVYQPAAPVSLLGPPAFGRRDFHDAGASPSGARGPMNEQCSLGLHAVSATGASMPRNPKEEVMRFSIVMMSSVLALTVLGTVTHAQ